MHTDWRKVLNDAALYVREQLLELVQVSSKNNMRDQLTTDDLLQESIKLPSSLVKILRVVVTGSSDECNEKHERVIQSVADDIIFSVSRGTVKPQKHILQGMAVKSITGSKTLLTILD